MVPENSVVLYVEDDLDDQIVFRECLHLARPDIICLLESDAALALNKLQSAKIKPVCIFIDVNMPGMDGNYFLAELKATPALSSIPCFMLSTSSHHRHIEQALKAGAEKYNAAKCLAVKYISGLAR